MFLPHPRVKVSIVGSLHDREVACSASDRQGSNFESCVWRTVSSQSSHHPQEVLLSQFSLYVHKGGLKPDPFHFIFICVCKNSFHRTISIFLCLPPPPHTSNGPVIHFLLPHTPLMDQSSTLSSPKHQSFPPSPYTSDGHMTL